MSVTYIPTALRKFVYERAANRCEYCLIPESVALVSHQIDHIFAEKHGGLTESENLALACSICNKHKGSDLTSLDPETGEIIPLFNPRKDVWRQHFLLVEANFVPLTAKARVTVQLLKMNTPERINERKILIKAELLKILN